MNKYILSILFFIYNCNIIVLPFRSVNKEKDFYKNCFMKELYTEVSIGSPPQNLNINLNPDNNFIFYISPDICYEQSPSYYNYSNSKTFFLISAGPEEDGFYELGGGTYARELFSFYNSTDLKNNVTNIMLEFFYSSYLSFQKNNQVCGLLGLGLRKRMDNYNFDTFLSTLKRKKLIDSYSWSYIFFTKDQEYNPKKILNMPKISDEYIIQNYDGLIIIGNISSIDNNNSDILSSLAVEREKELKWNIIINKIYNKYENINCFDKKLFLDLSINYEYIISPKEYFDILIIPYFTPFLEKKKCNLNSVKNDINIYEIVICNKNLFSENDIKKFPSLYFYHHDFNYTFELNYNDLFEIRNNDIFFLILNNKNEKDIWRMGKIFLKKYHFSFNQDSKTINFHLSNIKNTSVKINNKPQTKFQININYIWIFICIICLIFGIYLGNRFIIKNRKLRAYELQDDYEYKENNNNNLFLNEKNIEMKIEG